MNRNPTGLVEFQLSELTWHGNLHMSPEEEHEVKVLLAPGFISTLPLVTLSQEKQLRLLDSDYSALKAEFDRTLDQRVKRWWSSISSKRH